MTIIPSSSIAATTAGQTPAVWRLSPARDMMSGAGRRARDKGGRQVHGIQLGPIDNLILALYFVFVLGIGWALKRYQRTSEDFFPFMAVQST